MYIGVSDSWRVRAEELAAGFTAAGAIIRRRHGSARASCAAACNPFSGHVRSG